MRPLCLLIVSSIVLLFASTLAAGEKEGQVTIAVYNLQNYLRMERALPGKGVQRDVPKPDKEIQALIRIISRIHPDIIGVCEMGKPDQFRDFLDRLKESGLDYPHTEYVEAMDEDRHLALASRFPIIASNSQKHLSFVLNGSKHYFKRGILDVTVAVSPDYQLRLVGTHLKSKRDVPEDQSLLRRNEARLLRLHIEKILADTPEANLLVYGDLNDTINEAPIRDILGGGHAPDRLLALPLADDRGERWTHYWRVADLYSRIDYMMVSRGLLPETIISRSRIERPPDWDDASDHCPLVVAIQPTEAAQ